MENNLEHIWEVSRMLDKMSEDDPEYNAYLEYFRNISQEYEDSGSS